MKRRIGTATLAVVLAAAAAGAQPAPDWKAVEAEAIRTIQSYVRIDTSNPPGDVTKAADFLAAILQKEGVPVTRYESGPGRSIILARLKGSGTAKPLVLLNHMDVVPTDPDALASRPVRRRYRRRQHLGTRDDGHEGTGGRPAHGVPVAASGRTCRSTGT